MAGQPDPRIPGGPHPCSGVNWFPSATLIGGSVVIETIFQWPGIGNAFKTAVTGQNYPLVMMIALFSVLAVLMASFLVDILTAVLDRGSNWSKGETT